MKIESSNVVLTSNTDRYAYRNGNGFKEIYSKIKEASNEPHHEKRMNTVNLSSLTVHKFSPAVRQTVVQITEEVGSPDLDQDDLILDVEMEAPDKKRLAFLKQLLEQLTGKRVKFRLKDMPQSDNNPTYHVIISNVKTLRLSPNNPIPLQSSAAEQGSVPFKSEGSIKTADGREIKFSMESDLKGGSVSLQIPNGNNNSVDPLVVNLDTNTAGLTESKFNFDLNADGKLESISFTAPGSGFLALDKNNDGIINDGSELFGALSGDGFAELAEYDKDLNNWIDENDPVFEKLKVWSRDSSGHDSIASAVSRGIGAIFLGNVATAANLTGSSGNTLGQAAKTGVFLHENGTPGTIQHVNLSL